MTNEEYDAAVADLRLDDRKLDATAGDLPQALTQRMADEIHYWREYAGLRVKIETQAFLTAVLPQDRLSAERTLQDVSTMLRDALEGRLHPVCEATGRPIRPGDPVITYEDIGEAHAPDGAKVGDELPVPEDMRPEPDEGDPPHPGVVTVHAASDLYTPAQILQALEDGEEALKAARMVEEMDAPGAHPTPEACAAVADPG